MKQYDYIIAGAGCAGLSLVMHMIRSGNFSEKKILLVDKSEKKQNDRTWCFWEKKEGLFEAIVYRRWQKLWFYGKEHTACMDIHPYQYKMIRGSDFYNYCFESIHQQKNIELIFGDIEKTQSDNGETSITVDGKKFFGKFIFSSLLPEIPTLKKNQFRLLQHFKGWIIETKKDVFKKDEAILMDFRVGQENGTSFFYMMPLSATKALVEYTLFTEKLLADTQYDNGLRNYIREYLHIDEYKVEEEEFGVIPMTNIKFPGRVHNILYIGTAGGQTKASTGYTFQFIQKQSGEIVESLIKNGTPFPIKKKNKFIFYDSVLLNVLATSKLPGEKVFSDMFSKNKIGDIFNFLDNETDLIQDTRILSRFPIVPFIKAGWEQLLNG